MSATMVRPAGAVEPAGAGPEAGACPGAKPFAQLRDRHATAALGVLLVALLGLSWRKWGVPEIDAGAELTTADRVGRGALAYRDVRYFYGPLGLYALAAAFKVLGASFTTAYAFGLAQTTAILVAFYVLARHWLAPLGALLATALLMSIGLSGSAFNFVLPHSNSATLGILGLLLMLLMLSRERPAGAGVAVGFVGLTRPEYVAVAAGAVGAYLFATARLHGRAALWHAGWRIAAPGIAIPVVVLGWFAARGGLGVVLTENIWPTDFLRMAGFRTQANWTPFDLVSLLGLAARGACYGGLIVALVRGVEGFRAARGVRRLGALWPLGLACGLLVLADLTLGGPFAGQRDAIESEFRHLTIGMSWLPALGFAVAGWSLLRLVRGRGSPLGGSWPADLALVAAAAALGLRAYNAFTPTGSYADYYAAPLVLVAAIVHTRLAARRPQAATAVLTAFALTAAGLTAYSLGALYRHDTTAVHTPRGTFVTTAASAAPLAAAVRAIDAATRPGQPILAGPADGGLYFMADRPPALHEVMLLPGLLDNRADELIAIAAMRGAQVPLAVLGAREFSVWGTPTFGVDYDPVLGAHLRAAATSSQTFGELAGPVGGTNPSRGFQILHLATCADPGAAAVADCPVPRTPAGPARGAAVLRS